YEEFLASAAPYLDIPQEVQDYHRQYDNWDEWSDGLEGQDWWDQWLQEHADDSETEEGQDPCMDSIDSVICNNLSIEFDPYQEFPELFPEKTPTALPPIRYPYDIMQHRIDPPPGAKWHPRYYSNYNQFLKETTEKIKTELESGRLRYSNSESSVLLYTIPKMDKTKPRFIIDSVPRNLILFKNKTPLPSIEQIIQWVASKKLRSRYDLSNGFHNVR